MHAASRILIIIGVANSDFHRVGIHQWLLLINQAILIKIRPSPKRFVRTVIMPALKELGFE